MNTNIFASHNLNHCDAGPEYCSTGLNCNREVIALSQQQTAEERENARNELNRELYALNLRRITATKGSQELHEIEVKIKNVKERMKTA